ncbi:MAG: M28 family peptidase [Sphingobium yanoikuyae]|uniref:M28 family peptidase n=1 Tax=Sphingobium yanoikuyae TaxID=13690 RepID=UPI001B06CF47|nr:M28 family peptidase [Sphingobium yanoikuyae]
MDSEGADASDMPTKAILIATILLIIAAPIAILFWMTAVPCRSHQGPLPRLTAEQRALSGRLKTDVALIARKPHNTAHLREMDHVAHYIEMELRQAGYAPHRQPIRGVPGVFNIEAMLEPTDADAPTLVIGAHYDSYGTTPGANDNGSGTAATLELARALSDLRGRSRLRLRFAFFANEEPPYFQTAHMGSLAYAKALAAGQERTLGMISLETIGFYSDAKGSQHYPFPLSALYPDTGNFIAFVGMTSSRPFIRATVAAFRREAAFPSVGGSAPGFVQGIDWSDHWAFAQVGIPALMITDTAPFRYRYYHSEADTPDRLDYDRMARVVDGVKRVVRAWARKGAL